MKELSCEKQDCPMGGVEEYIEKRYREECWKFWADDERMSGSGFGMSMAISIYTANHPERREEFIQEYNRKITQEAYEQTKEELAKINEESA